MTIEAGDFFKAVPAGGDVYVLSHIIHDWDENCCLTILRNIHSAMNANGRLLIVEMVLPEGDAPHPGKMLDILMLVATGGQDVRKLSIARFSVRPASGLLEWCRPIHQ